jgi:5-methylcytosine-specific restriction endonuclease McrA
VHHIIPISVAYNLRLKIWNLILLCAACHLQMNGSNWENHRARLQALADARKLK